MSNNTSFLYPEDFLWGATLPPINSEDDLLNTNWENRYKNHFIGQPNSNPKLQDIFERLSSYSIKTLIFPLDWAKIQPAPDYWNENKIDQYRNQVRNLTEKNILPMINFFSNVEPKWFYEQGGWENSKSIDYFFNYCKKTFESLFSYTDHWITFHQVNRYMLSVYWLKKFTPGIQYVKSIYKIQNNIFQAHKQVYLHIKEIQKESKITVSYQHINLIPQSKFNPIEKFFSAFYNNFYNQQITKKLNPKKQIFFNRNSYNFKFLDFFLITYSGDQCLKISKKLQFKLEDTFTVKGFNKLLFNTALSKKKIFLEANFHINGQYDFVIEYVHKIWRFTNLNPFLVGCFLLRTKPEFDMENGYNQNLSLLESTSLKNDSRQGAFFQSVFEKNEITYDFVQEYAPKIINKLFP